MDAMPGPRGLGRALLLLLLACGVVLRSQAPPEAAAVRWCRRAEVVGNRVWEAPNENIALGDYGNRRSRFDSNVLQEGAGRFIVMFGAPQNLIRRNEIHNKFRNDAGSDCDQEILTSIRRGTLSFGARARIVKITPK